MRVNPRNTRPQISRTWRRLTTDVLRAAFKVTYAIIGTAVARIRVSSLELIDSPVTFILIFNLVRYIASLVNAWKDVHIVRVNWNTLLFERDYSFKIYKKKIFIYFLSRFNFVTV